jgi:uncharacterized protein (DUF1499 family)
MKDSSKPLVTGLAILALVAGIAIGAYALAAPLGVWLGLWQFNTGFQMLFGADGVSATGWGLWVAIGAALAAVIVFILARRKGMRSGRLTAFALIGAIAAAIAYAVPSSYRPGADIPGIHDITTDTSDPPQFVAVLPLRASAPNTTVYGGGPNETPETLAAAQHQAYPDIVPQRFDEPPATVFARAAAAARELGWEIVAEVPAEGRIEATDTTFWFRFKDDIVIRIRPTAAGAVLDARSVSRVGRGDAGKNAWRLRKFIAAL